MEWLNDCTDIEKTWIRRCAKKDPKAQEFLFRHFFGFAMGISLRYLNNPHLAQESVNDSFLKIFDQLPGQIENLQSFRGWMRKLVVNTAIDYFRKEKRNFFLSELDEHFVTTTSGEDPGENQTVEEILSLLNMLPPLWRVVFNFNEVEGYSHEEIAKILKIPASSSRAYLTKAKQKLRELISLQNRILK